MRNWLTPRCVLIMLLLLAAPGAALAHLLVTWAPERFGVARLSREIVRNAAELDDAWEQNRQLREACDRLQRAARVLQTRVHSNWMLQRDRHQVFERLAAALRDERVSIERLTLGGPELFTAASRADLLACERADVVCTGDYAALTACLDRLVELNLPLRVVDLSWERSAAGLSLVLRLQVPFLPDAALREALADAAGLEEDDEA